MDRMGILNKSFTSDAAAAADDDSDSEDVDPIGEKATKVEGERKKESEKVEKAIPDRKEIGEKPKKMNAKKKKNVSGENFLTTGRLKTLSPALASIVGAAEMHRYEVVRQVWKYIRDQGLQVPVAYYLGSIGLLKALGFIVEFFNCQSFLINKSRSSTQGVVARAKYVEC